MPPKKAVEGPEEDLNPFGAFVNISIAHAVLQLLPPTEAPPGKGKVSKATNPVATAGPPQLHLTLHLPGNYAPVKGQPTEHAGDGTYSFVFSGRSRREPSMDAMHELINGPAKLSVVESASNTCLATAHVDMWDFGLGATDINMETLQLQPDSNVPANCTKVAAGVLHAVRLWLTHRPAPAEPAPTPTTVTSRPTTPSGVNKAGKTADAAASSFPSESDLPSPLPFSFLTPQQLTGGNLIELSVAAVSNLPPSLPAAVAAASDGKAGGKVTFSVGLRAPEGPSVVIYSGSLVAGSEPQIVFQPATRRCYVTAQQAQAIHNVLEDGKPLVVEVARYLTHDSMTDPAWQAYLAQALVPAAANLLQPGVTCTAPADTGTQVTPLEPCDGALSALPPYMPPQGKISKTMEEAPAAGTCVWAEAVSQLVGLSVRLGRPLLAAWQPPPKPSMQLNALIPTHSELQPFKPPDTAKDMFHSTAQAMVGSLSRVIETAGGHGDGNEEGQKLVAALEADGRLRQLKTALKQHAMAVALETYHLDLEGRPLDDDKLHSCLDDLNSWLATAVDVAVHGGAPAMTQQQQQQAKDSTTDMQTELQVMLQRAAECEANGAWLRAADLHQQRVMLVTEAQHAAGQASSNTLCTQAACVWHEYATFCLRHGETHQGRAEQALRRALQVDASHWQSLAALCALLLHQGRVTDPLNLQEATQVAKQLLACSQGQSVHACYAGGSSLAWGLLLMVCQAAGDKALAQDMAAALSGLQQAEDDALQQTSQAADLQHEHPVETTSIEASAKADDSWTVAEGMLHEHANGLLAVALMAAELRLPAVALDAVQQAQAELPRSSNVPAVRNSLMLASARAWTQVHAAAVQACKTASQHDAQEQLTAEVYQAQMETALTQGIASCDAARAASAHGAQQVDIIEGQLQYQAVHWTGCIEALARLVQAASAGQHGQHGSCPPLQVYLQLAHSYERLGWLDQARNVYMQACVMRPCATCWLGLAQCHQRMSEDSSSHIEAVQAALAQAMACDPDNPIVWAELAKQALNAGHQEEAAIHVSNALQLGCDDAPLLLDVAQRCHALGMLSQARSCMDRALLVPSFVPAPRVRLTLAEVCLDVDDAAAAHAHVEAAMSAATKAGDASLQADVEAFVPRMLDAQLASSNCAA